MFKHKRSKNVYKKYVRWIPDYFKHLVVNYLKESNLHGCRYIVNSKDHKIFSVAWAIIFLISLVFCALLILIQLKRFQETAVLNSIASTGFPAWKVPFPAVIICNNNIVYKGKADNIKAMISNKGFQESDIDQFLMHLSDLVVCQDCRIEDPALYNNTVDIQIASYLEELNYGIDELMLELAHPCEKMMKRCYWKSEEYNCSHLFKRVKTTLGYCCAFNYFGTFNVQYTNFEEHLEYSGGFGLGSGLQVVINIEPSEYVSSIKTSPGIELLVGHAYQFAEMGLYSHSLVGGQVMNVGLFPTVYGSNADIKYISDKSRGCWFSQEGQLRWSRTYNTLTCFNECKASYIYETCGCVPFYYSFTGIRKVCNMEDLNCLLKNEGKFAKVMMSNDIEDDSKFIEEQEITNSKLCYCLPSCEEISYEIYKNTKGTNHANNTSTLNVYFNTITATYMVRNIHVTWDTLLATIGGIFGLCMGGSILSVVELVYITLNSCVKVKNKQNEEKRFADETKKIKFVSKVCPSHVKSQFLN